MLNTVQTNDPKLMPWRWPINFHTISTLFSYVSSLIPIHYGFQRNRSPFNWIRMKKLQTNKLYNMRTPYLIDDYTDLKWSVLLQFFLFISLKSSILNESAEYLYQSTFSECVLKSLEVAKCMSARYTDYNRRKCVQFSSILASFYWFYELTIMTVYNNLLVWSIPYRYGSKHTIYTSR